MYTYNKDDKSYTFSSDDIDLDELIDIKPDDEDKVNLANNMESENLNSESDMNEEPNKPHKKIEVINGGNDLDISPVTNYIEIEKPKNEKKENIVIPEEKK